MKQFICAWIVSFVVMIALDAVWLMSMTSRFYKPYLNYIFADDFKYMIGLIFYLLYSAGVAYLILMPTIIDINSTTVADIFIKGCVLGCIAYGAYDLTNHATIKNWPAIVTIVDMTWGTCVTGLTSVISYLILQKYCM